MRTYSLSGDPAGGSYRISVKGEALGLVSDYLRTHLEHGVTPLLAMPHRLADETSAREVWWIHTTHAAHTHAMAAEAADLVGRLPAAPDSGIRVGRLTAAVIADLGLPTDATAYVCGPESFMSEVLAGLANAGIDRADIHTGRFGSRSAVNPGVVRTEAPPPHQPSGPPGTSPSVTFARTGLATGWSDRYGSILELAEACDVPTQWSCRTGVCHTCVTAVLSGDASYDVAPLEDPGRHELLICSATPSSDLVVGL